MSESISKIDWAESSFAVHNEEGTIVGYVGQPDEVSRFRAHLRRLGMYPDLRPKTIADVTRIVQSKGFKFSIGIVSSEGE